MYTSKPGYISISASKDYYPFGMLQPERQFSSDKYRYGFGSHEKDDEVKGVGNHISFGDYGYDSRLGRRWQIDPKFKENLSPYSTFSNNPLLFIDPDGKDTLVVHMSGKIAEMSTGKSSFYLVTFSLVQNGIETQLPGRMLMLGSAEYQKKIPYTNLSEPVYTLTITPMPSKPWLSPTINITGGSFIHQGNTYREFKGCYGLSDKMELLEYNYSDGEKVFGLGSDTQGSIEKVVNMYKNFEKVLTGAKFILMTNSIANTDESKQRDLNSVGGSNLEPSDVEYKPADNSLGY